MKNICLVLSCLLLVTSLSWAADICLVRDGQPQAQIVLPEGASDQLKATAGRLVAFVKEASGAELPVAAENALPAATPPALVLLGQTKRQPVTFPKDFDEDGFIIEARGQTISICGPTDWGTEFGVYDFLERHVGVRWLLPGKDGTDVPVSKTLNVPEGRVQDQPVFFSRLFSGLRGAPQGEWARYNRMRGRVSFHHNLNKLFPPDQYTKSHPHFFPMLDGQTRYLAKGDEDHGWQPCFTAPGIVEEAIKNIVQYFKDNPTVTSYSLGMNDSGKFCACPDCLKHISGEKNYLGWVDYSELYYAWCNQVIEGVLKVYPDKWFGCLAYFNVMTPPQKVKVHPRLVPYITYDRMKWIEPELFAAGQKDTRSWQQTVPTFAWYDYIYGTPYCLPRVYFHHAQKYLQFGAETGVKAHYAEIYPNFGEGPKPYIHLKLWWNPRQDVDKLLAEWYERCVGPEAAPYLAQYYAIWERFWTEDIRESAWFPKTSGTWLPFGSPGYLADVKREDIAESRRLLEQTIAKCQTPRQKARAELLEKAFQYYEASALAYLAQPQFATLQTDTEAHALAAVESAVQGLTMAAHRRHLALEVFPHDPVLVNPLGIDRFGMLAGDSWGGAGLWAVADWVKRGDNAVRRRVEELAAKSETALIRSQANILLAVVDGKTELVSTNPSFEEGEGTNAKGWSFWLKPDTGGVPPIGRMLRSQDVAHDGKYSLLCDAMQRGGPVMTMDFPGPGQYLGLAWVYVPEGQQSVGTVELSITPLDEQGRNLPGVANRVEPRPGQWTMVMVGLETTGKIGERTVSKFRLIPIVDGFDRDGGKVYFDEVGLHRIKR
jgi:hypothetical protein